MHSGRRGNERANRAQFNPVEKALVS
jgi:hypothetical protein